MRPEKPPVTNWPHSQQSYEPRKQLASKAHDSPRSGKAPSTRPSLEGQKIIQPAPHCPAILMIYRVGCNGGPSQNLTEQLLCYTVVQSQKAVTRSLEKWAVTAFWLCIAYTRSGSIAPWRTYMGSNLSTTRSLVSYSRSHRSFNFGSVILSNFLIFSSALALTARGLTLDVRIWRLQTSDSDV